MEKNSRVLSWGDWREGLLLTEMPEVADGTGLRWGKSSSSILDMGSLRTRSRSQLFR